MSALGGIWAAERLIGALRPTSRRDSRGAPTELDARMLGPDPVRAQRVIAAMLKVHGKLDIAALRAAFSGE